VNFFLILLHTQAKMNMAIFLMIIDAEHVLTVRKIAFSAFKRSFNFFHNVFTYPFWVLLLSEQKTVKVSSLLYGLRFSNPLAYCV